jgi:hypothetical protein
MPEGLDSSVIFERSQAVMEEIKAILPVYHNRAMKRAMFKKSAKPAVLKYFYKELTG